MRYILKRSPFYLRVSYCQKSHAEIHKLYIIHAVLDRIKLYTKIKLVNTAFHKIYCGNSHTHCPTPSCMLSTFSPSVPPFPSFIVSRSFCFSYILLHFFSYCLPFAPLSPNIDCDIVFTTISITHNQEQCEVMKEKSQGNGCVN